MAEAVYVALEFIAAEIGTEMVLTAGQLMFAANAITLTAGAALVAHQQEAARRAAREAWNKSQRDRYVMLRDALAPRQLVMGTRRVSGPMVYVGSHGEKLEHLVYVVPLAAHEVDAIGTVYAGDEPVTLDEAGNVLGIQRTQQFSISTTSASFDLGEAWEAGTLAAQVEYGSTIVPLTVSATSGTTVTLTGATAGVVGLVVISYRPADSPFKPEKFLSGKERFTASSTTTTLATGTDNIRLGGYAGISLHEGGGVWTSADTAVSISVSGSNLVLTGTTPGAEYEVWWQYTTAPSLMRVRKYLGTGTQAADAGMIAALPGIWTSAHTLTGIAYLVIECDYDQDAFSGMYQISAEVRGAKILDPRTGVTAYTENPALQVHWYATHPLGGRLPSGAVASVVAAANVCDLDETRTIGGAEYTGPRYRAHYAARTDQRPVDVITDLCAAMGGEWVYWGGQLRVKAGAWRAPVAHITTAWLQGDQPIQVVGALERDQMVNRIRGKWYDARRGWRECDAPEVPESSITTYTEADGADLVGDLDYPAVTELGQQQYLAACRVRADQQGLGVVLRCNLRAYVLEPFDVVAVTLPEFGWEEKTFEVRNTVFSASGGIELTLRETGPSVWDVDAEYPALDPEPNTRLPDARTVPALTGLNAASGPDHLLVQADGTVVTRLWVTWDAPTAPALLEAGARIDIAYRVAGSDDWLTERAPGTAPGWYLRGLPDGANVILMARGVGPLAAGPWSGQIARTITGKDTAASAVAGLAGTLAKGQAVWSWTADSAADYAATEVRATDSGWGGSGALWRGAGTGWAEPLTAAGSLTRHVRHVDTSGNVSATSASHTLTVTAEDLLADPPSGYISDVHTVARRLAATSGDARLRLTTDGEVWVKGVISMRYDAQFHAPTTTGLGAGLWVRVTSRSGSAAITGDSLGTWLQLNADREWVVSRSTVGLSSAEVDILIATDSTGASIVCRRSALIEIEVTT